MTIKQLEELWEKEYNRIQRELKRLAKQNEEIGSIPMPRKPKRVTEASLQRLKKIDTDYLKKKVKSLSKEIGIQSKNETIENKTKKPRTSLTQEPTRKGRIKGNGWVGITDEQRREELRKAREAQKKREAEDPVYAEAMRKKRAEAARKAREAQKKREAEDPEYAEAMRKKRAESARKARQAQKKREAEEPEYAEAMRKKRAESARKAREAQKKREAEDPEYAEAMRKKREESLRKAREEKQRMSEDPEYSADKRNNYTTREKTEKEISENDDKTEREITKDIVEKISDEIKEEIDFKEIDKKIGEELNNIYTDEYENDEVYETEIDEETQIGIDTETGEIDDTTLDIIETVNKLQDISITDYEPDTDYSRSSGIIDRLKDLLENPATEMNKEYADVALRALDDIVSYNELNGTIQEWLKSIERTPKELISNAEVISQSSDAGDVQQSVTDFLIILYGSYSEIPESVLEASDVVKNYVSFRTFSSSKFDMT